jgi:hypothetical protein
MLGSICFLLVRPPSFCRHKANPLAEGLMTIFVAGIVALVLPASPVDGGRSLIGRILSERDAAVLASRTIRDDPKKAKGGMQHKVTWDDIKSTLTAWQLYGHCAAALLSS